MKFFPARNILFALVFTLITLAQPARAFKTVLIDPGHGGHDRGATASGYFEKHMALDTARRVEAILKSKGYRVVLTRRSDYFVTLRDRSKMGNSYSNAVFVSIHYNSASNTGAYGLETYYYHADSYVLASYIQAYLIQNTGLPNRGVKKRSFHVIRETTRIPSVLVECGFISSSKERSKMRYGAHRAELAKSIAQGIIAADRHK